MPPAGPAAWRAARTARRRASAPAACRRFAVARPSAAAAPGRRWRPLHGCMARCANPRRRIASGDQSGPGSAGGVDPQTSSSLAAARRSSDAGGPWATPDAAARDHRARRVRPSTRAGQSRTSPLLRLAPRPHAARVAPQGRAQQAACESLPHRWRRTESRRNVAAAGRECAQTLRAAAVKVQGELCCVRRPALPRAHP
eukprot:1354317-Prymnesium_polylepis.1